MASHIPAAPVGIPIRRCARAPLGSRPDSSLSVTSPVRARTPSAGPDMRDGHEAVTAWRARRWWGEGSAGRAARRVDNQASRLRWRARLLVSDGRLSCLLRRGLARWPARGIGLNFGRPVRHRQLRAPWLGLAR